MHRRRDRLQILPALAACLAPAACAHVPVQVHSPLLDSPQFVADMAANDGLVIGEIHGTSEAPAAFAALVESLPGRTLVAIEQPVDAAALDCAGGPLPPSWRGPEPDGRSSIAMFDMMCRLRALEKRGKVEVLLVDDRAPDKPQYYDTAAAAIRAAMARGGHDRFLAYTGNFHSSITGGHLPEALQSEGLRSLGVTMSSPAGTAWMCRIEGEGQVCGIVGTSGTFCPEDGAAKPGWRRYESVPRQWDRCMTLPSMTASNPAAAR